MNAQTDESAAYPEAGAAADPRAALAAVRTEVGKAVVGQDAVVTGLVIALLCRGHVLLEGVPGRRQDPAGPVPRGRAVAGHQARAVHPGPDARRRHRLAGLRRAHARGSSSGRARSSPTCCSPTRSTGRRRRPRRRCSRRWRSVRSRSTARRARCRTPFLVAATQNPVEYEGTYPLPEAQLDRFLLKLTRAAARPGRGDRASWTGTRRLRPAGPGRGRASGRSPAPPSWPPAGPPSRRCRCPPEVTRLHRRHLPGHPDRPRRCRSGVSPRGATALLATAAAWAWLSGRDYVTPDDVKALARPDAAAPGPAAAGGRARGRHARTACSTASSPPSRSRAERGTRAGSADGADRPGGARGAARGRWSCWRSAPVVALAVHRRR